MISDKLGELVQDDYGRLRLVIDKKGFNYYVLSEKLVSLRMWFDIFYESFCSYDLNELRKLEINKETIELINYLSICNGIFDVSLGLSMIVDNVFMGYEYPSKSSFKNTRKYNEEHDTFFEIADKDDKLYFKHVRAIFGQHPSNLDYLKNGKPMRGFSSWTFNNNTGLTNDISDIFSNIYYDLSEKGWGIKFHLFYDEIKEFTNDRIELIDNLIKCIKTETETYIESNCATKIEGFDNLSLLDKINTLKNEVRERYGYEDYHYLESSLSSLLVMTKFHSIPNYIEKEKEFFNAIRECVNEILPIVEACGNDELPFYSSFSGNIYDTIGHTYWREKCAMYINGDTRYLDMFSKVCILTSDILEVTPEFTIGDFLYRLYLVSKKGEVVIPKT